MSTMKPFYLAVGPDETSAIYDTEGGAMALVGFTEAIEIFHCTPDEGRMRPVTEDLASEWWFNFGRKGGYTVPECYRQWLEREIEEAEAPRRGQREIGTEYLHYPERF